MGIAVGLQFLPKIKPYQNILYLTFSKFAKIRIYKEAKFHLKEQNMTKEEYRRIRVENFHSLWWNFLKENWKFLGISQPPSILTMEELINESESHYNILVNEDLIPAHLQSRKEQNIKKILRREALPKHLEYCEKKISNFQMVLKRIKELLIKQNQNGKFWHDDTINWIQKLFSKDKNIIYLFKNKYPVIIIDEFQDTDERQWEIIQILNPHTLIIFGDNEQRIHQYRMENKNRLQDFWTKYPNYQETELINLYRFKKRPNCIIGEINTSDYDNSKEKLNLIKSRVEYKCLNIVKEELRTSISIAILCRNAKQVDDIAAFFWESGYFIRKDGSNNSPFEKLRKVIIRLISNSSEDILIDYLRYLQYPQNYNKKKFEMTILKEIFPTLSKYERNKGVQINQRTRKPICKAIIDLIGLNFAKALTKFKDYLVLIGKTNGNMKYDRIFVKGLIFISRRIRTFGITKWKQLDQKQQREKIDDYILNYENTVLLSSRNEKISIMTVHQAKSRQFDVVIFPWFSTLAWELRIPPLKLYVNDGIDFYIFLNANTRAKHKFYVLSTLEYSEDLPENYPEFDENELKSLIKPNTEVSNSSNKKMEKNKRNKNQTTLDSLFKKR
jgi:superfamily I DNA/RNA helicase